MNDVINFLLNNKAIFSTIIAIFALCLFIVLVKKYKLTKYQIIIFLMFTLFWMSIIVIRSYRKIYIISPVETGGLGFDELLAVSVTSIYGLISIFVRLPIFVLSDYFKSRKIFILMSIFFIGTSSLIAYINPTYVTLFASSLSIGIGASFISLFNVMFAETFTNENAIKSVSILSIAPLFGEFLSAPIQYVFTCNEIKNYNGLWLVSSILALIAFICCLFFKDNKTKVRNYNMKKVKEVLCNKTFLLFCALGIIVSFIKFASSGANYLALVKLKEINMSALGLAYSDVIFSFSQLIAGVLAGTYLKRKFGIKKTLVFGILCTIVFLLTARITTSSIVLFLTYAFNGFGYGITYNVLIGLAMQPFKKDYREVSMSIFQTFFAIGIYYGDKIYSLIFKLFKSENMLITYRSVISIISITAIITYIIILLTYKEKNMKKYVDEKCLE